MVPIPGHGDRLERSEVWRIPKCLYLLGKCSSGLGTRQPLCRNYNPSACIWRPESNAFKDTGYFINDHHASQFRKTFPQIWSALEHGVSSSAQSAFKSALRVLQSSAPTTFISLQKAGIIY